MKTITIGRDSGSDIIIDEKSISRRHALIRIYPTGKMELVDMSSNGTFVNNVRLAGNVPFPISRKDKVNFAGVKNLDWRLVPNPLSWIKWVVIAVCSFALLIILGTLISRCSNSTQSYSTETTEPVVSKPNTKLESENNNSQNKNAVSDSKDSNNSSNTVSTEDRDTKESSAQKADETKTSNKVSSNVENWPDRTKPKTTKPSKPVTTGNTNGHKTDGKNTEKNSEQIINGI